MLAGGGARGAYEMGVLSALPDDEQPNLILGTSVGALNATLLAGSLQKGPREALAGGRAIWDEIRWSQVLASPSLVDLERLFRGVLGFVGVPGMDVPGLLDPSPLEDTVKRRIDFEQIEQNRSGREARRRGCRRHVRPERAERRLPLRWGAEAQAR